MMLGFIILCALLCVVSELVYFLFSLHSLEYAMNIRCIVAITMTDSIEATLV